MLIPPKIFPIATCCGEESHRKYTAINHVRLERDEQGRPHAIATDGCVLVATTWQEAKGYPTGPDKPDPKTLKGWSATVPAKDWKTATKLVPKRPAPKILQHLVVEEKEDYGEQVLGTVGLHTSHRMTLKSPNNLFPSWQKVLADHHPTKKSATVTVDASRLALLVKLLTTLSDKTKCHRVQLTISANSDEAVLFRCCTQDGIKTKAMLMPLEEEE